MDKIQKFYQLDRIINSSTPLSAQLGEKAINAIFTKKQVELFFSQTAGVYRMRETVIGGRREHKITII